MLLLIDFFGIINLIFGVPILMRSRLASFCFLNEDIALIVLSRWISRAADISSDNTNEVAFLVLMGYSASIGVGLGVAAAWKVVITGRRVSGADFTAREVITASRSGVRVIRGREKGIREKRRGVERFRRLRRLKRVRRLGGLAAKLLKEAEVGVLCRGIRVGVRAGIRLGAVGA
jgi:hypothetical protein